MNTRSLDKQNLASTAPGALRRNPLTGTYVDLAVGDRAPGLARRLQGNALPLTAAVQYANPDDPLLRLGASSRVSDGAWRTHREAAYEVPLAFTPELAEVLVTRYTSMFETLVPRTDIAELSILEECSAGQVQATVSGYLEPTARTQNLATEASRWARRTGGDLLADVLTAELVDGARILLNNRHWLAYLPYAPEAPLEILLVPKRASRNLVAITDSARADLLATYRQLYTLLFEVLGSGASFTALWSMAPIPWCREVSRLHLSITAAELPAPLEGASPEALAEHLRAHL